LSVDVLVQRLGLEPKNGGRGRGLLGRIRETLR